MKVRRLFKILILIFFMIININIVDVSAEDDGYYIENFNVGVAINDKREYIVTETIDVYFKEDRHGIIREIPKGKGLEGYDITNINVEGAPYSIDSYSNIVIKIGDEDEEINGKKQYIISYIIKSYDDEKADGDYIRINLLGDEWDTKIKNFKATVIYPAESTLQKADVFSGPYGSTSNEYTEYEAKDNTIVVQSKKEINSNCGVTLSAVFNEGTFKNAVKKEYPYEIINQNVNIDITEEKEYILTRQYEINVKDNDIISTIPFWYDNYDVLTDIYCSDESITIDDYSKTLTLPRKKGTYKFTLSCEVWPSLKDDVNLFINDYHVKGKNKNLTINISSPYSLNKAIILYNKVKNGDINEKYKVEVSDNNLRVYDLENVIFGDSIEIITNIDNTLFERQLPKMTNSIPWVSCIVLIISIILYLFLRESPLNDDSIEVSPPYNMNNIEIAYIYNNKITQNDIWNILFYWANQGHISINILKGNKFNVTKLSTLDDEHKDYEVEIFEFLFSKSGNKTVSSKNLKGKTAVIENKTRKSVKNYFKKEKRITSLLSIFSCVVCFGLALIPMNLFFIVYGIYEYNSWTRMLFLSIIGIIQLVILFRIEYRSNEKSLRTKGVKRKLSLTIITSLIFIGLFYIESLGCLLPAGYNIIFILSTVISVSISARIINRTAYGREVTEKIIKFRRFIENGEKKNIEALLEENPEYFYYILPYSNALKVTEMWAGKFNQFKKTKSRNIVSYRDYDDYLWMSNSLNSSFDKALKVYSTTVTSSSSSDSSYSGGDYSGGGSGGGGGSSW